jgi:hypothetical protein
MLAHGTSREGGGSEKRLRVGSFSPDGVEKIREVCYNGGKQGVCPKGEEK